MNERLAAVLAEVFDMRKADIHTGLQREDVGTWDSLRQMDLVVSLEREYGLTLDIPDMVRMVSVAGIVKVLQDKGVHLEG
jgi:acyl carrier protein